MEQFLDQVKLLSPEELRARLAEFGEVVGPILPTTQPLFQKRLARKLAAAATSPAISPKSSDGTSNESSSSYDTSTAFAKEEKKTEDSVKRESDNAAAHQYFGVCLLGNVNEVQDTSKLVFTDKTEALKEVKKHSGARFKVFKTREEAEHYCQIGQSPWKQSAQTKSATDTSGQSSVLSVEGCPFKAPKPEELTDFRKKIEAGDYPAVETMVWENPRFLISSGDTPVILQEGFRYNSLHIAAKFNQPAVCQLIMDTIEDPNFVDKLYSHTNETQQTRTNRINFIVDLYLNMPDKGNCESPLHFASKFGFGEVVSILVAHPKVDKDLKNKYGDTAADIICSRCSGASESDKSEIRELLQGQYYVPLGRSEDNTTQPLIGNPWSPDMSRSPLSVSMSSWNPKDPLMAIKAFAGPTTPSKAEKFHKQWTMPPSGSPDHVKRKFVITRREDSDKGLERLGRELAHKMSIPWLEYWEFLETYADLSSEDGFELLEEYFQKQRIALCLADGIEKLDLIMNRSFHGNKEMVLSNFSWNLLSLTEELEEVLRDSETEKDKCGHLGDIEEDVFLEKPRESSPQRNGSAYKMENGAMSHNGTPPLMRSSMHRSNLYSTPIGMDTYGYGRYFMNRSMDRSDLMSQSVESISNSSSPMSCLTALFARLSLLDRSRTSKGYMKGFSCTSCMGNKSAYVNSNDYPMDASFASSTGSRPYAKVPYFKEALDKYNESFSTEDQQNSDKVHKADDNTKPDYKFLAREKKLEKTVTISDEIEFDKDCCHKQGTRVSTDSSKSSDNETFYSCPSDTDNKSGPELEESIEKQLKDLDLTPDNKVGDTSEDTDSSWQTASNHLNLVLEMDRDKISGAMFESLFETLNERKNIENISRYIRGSNSSPTPNKQDIVLDLKDENVFVSDFVVANVAVIPLHCSVTEMKLFPDIPFKVIRGDNSMDQSVDGTSLPSLVDIKFYFGRDTVMQALAISNSLKSKIFYIHGYLPTKADLDAYRAMELSSVDKNRFPLLTHWKSQISSHAKDSTFTWQSPAKVRKQSNLSSSFPLAATPASKHSSIYNSPVSGGSPRRSMSSTWSMPNIRTQLFSPVPNRLSLNLDG